MKNEMNESLKQALKDYLIAKSEGRTSESILVTRDSKLQGLLPATVDPSNIEAIYTSIVNSYNGLLQENNPVMTPPTAPIEAPTVAPASAPIEAPEVAPPTAPVEVPRMDKRPSEMIAEVRRDVLSSDTSGASSMGAQAPVKAKTMKMTLTNPDVPTVTSAKNLNEIGYANIVLMSIIVIIIVAIICVFIFL